MFIYLRKFKESIKNLKKITQIRSQDKKPAFRKILWKRDRLTTPVFLGFPGGLDGK